MKLTKEQIDLLRKLISYKGHIHLDVQEEILNRIVSPVEELLKNEPELEIQEAFSRVFRSYGSKGFNEIERTYQKQVEKRYYRLVWEEFTSFLLSFRLLLLIVLFGLFYQFRQLFGSEFGWILGLLGLFMVCFIPFYIFFRRKYKSCRQYAPFGTVQNNFTLLALIFNLCSLCFTLLTNRQTAKDQPLWGYSIIVFSLITALYIYLFILPFVLNRLKSDVDLIKEKFAFGQKDQNYSLNR